MEYFKKQYRSGVIAIKTYDKMMEIVAHLEQNGYGFIEKISEGSYGSVLKVKHLESEKELAAKVVEKKHATDGEINLWKTLHHDNILKLSDMQFVYYADSYIFLSPVYRQTLEQKVFESSFMSNKNAPKQAITWLKQILDAIVYIHDKDLSHNDLKSNNILISDTGTAVVADFGFLTAADNLVQKYGTPFIYRCPEARLSESGLTPIDGKKLDIWTVGMLTFEMFTKMSLLIEMSKPNTPLSCWFTDIYPMMQKNLQKENFIKLMQEAFPTFNKTHEIADDITSFITLCLNLIPEKRPSIRQLQKHKLLGSTFKNVKYSNEIDIWKKRFSVREFNVILEQNKLEKIPENLIEEACNNDSSQVDVDADFIVSEQNTKKRKVFNHEIEPCSGDIMEENHSHPIFNKNNQFSENSEFIASPHPVQGNKSFSAIFVNHNSVNLSDPQTSANPQYDFEFDLSENNEVFVAPFTLSFRKRKNSSYCQKLRKWLNQRKFKASKFFTECCLCLKNSGSGE